MDFYRGTNFPVQGYSISVRTSSRRALRSSESSSACSSNTISCTLSSSFSIVRTSCRERNGKQAEGWQGKRENGSNSVAIKHWVWTVENVFTECKCQPVSKTDALSVSETSRISKTANVYCCSHFERRKKKFSLPPAGLGVPVLAVQSEYGFWTPTLLPGWSRHWLVACSHPAKNTLR